MKGSKGTDPLTAPSDATSKDIIIGAIDTAYSFLYDLKRLITTFHPYYRIFGYLKLGTMK